MRLFTAIELPDAARGHLQRVRSKLMNTPGLADRVSWVRPENLHITLKFIGEVPDPEVKALIDSLSRVTVESMELFAAHMLYFPKSGPARVIGAGFDGEVQKLQGVFQQIEDACEHAGFRREGRRFTAHTTLGRARKGVRIGHARDLDVGRAFPGPGFAVSQFVLMRSELKPTGSIYTPAARFGR